MAIANIRKSLQDLEVKLYKELAGGKGRIAASNRFMHIIKVHKTTFSTKMVYYINEAFKTAGYTKQVVTQSEMDAVVGVTMGDWRQGKHGLTGVRAKIKSPFLIIRRASNKEKEYSEFAQKVNAQFREDVYNQWSSTFGKKGRPEWDTIMEQVTEDTGFSHAYGQEKGQKSNVANAGLLELMERLDGGGVTIDEGVQTIDAASWVMERLRLGWTRKFDPVQKKLVWVVSGELAGYNPDHKPGDDLGPEWEKKVMDRLDALVVSKEFKDLKDPDFKASEPFTHKIGTGEMKKIADLYLKEAGFTRGGQKIKVKNVPKASKKEQDSGKVPPLRTGKQTSKKRKVTLSKKSAVVVTLAKKEKGQGKQASTQGARELVRLKTYIQSRLTAEVERNMGRDGALTKRKGRFSRSVELKSLHQAAQTVVAKYTYLLSPYQTFENTGKRRWRLSYNPKTLIAKSIRNLAQGRIEQKLTVRRV